MRAEPVSDQAIQDVAMIARNGIDRTIALERVIAEQQKEIDRLRSAEKSNNERWQHENKAVERVALAGFSVLNHPDNLERRLELKLALMEMGFCPRCESRPCECCEGD